VFCPVEVTLFPRSPAPKPAPRSAVGEDAMKLRTSGLLVIAGFLVACLLGAAQSLAQNAYITNASSDTVSVIDTTRWR
jgi:hypothetical protein